MQGFSQGIPYPPADLSPENLQQRLQRLFIPAWLVDASALASWQAEAGFNYEVVSHQEKYSDTQGGWRTQEVKEPRVRWEPRLGKLERTYQLNTGGNTDFLNMLDRSRLESKKKSKKK